MINGNIAESSKWKIQFCIICKRLMQLELYTWREMGVSNNNIKVDHWGSSFIQLFKKE